VVVESVLFQNKALCL